MIYHITSRIAWLAAQKAGLYTADTLTTEGFIHCSKRPQIMRVANKWYAGRRGLVLLEIDETRLRAEVRWEAGTDKPDELFPHLYGALNLDAVRRVLDFPPDEDGLFRRLPQ